MKQDKNIRALIAFFIVLLIIFIAGIAGKGVTLYDVTNVLLFTPVRKIGFAMYRASTSVKNKRAYFLSKENLLKENESLKSENKILEERIKLIQSVSNENIRLKEILHIEENRKVEATVANVIGRTEAPFKFIIIDKGSRNGIKTGDPVTETDGEEMFLVGIVYNVSTNTSKVLMLTDPLFFVSVKDRNSGEIGIAQGNVTNIKIPFKVLEPKVFKNDTITTTSISSIFPQGIIVGSVNKIIKNSSVETTVTVTPSVDFDHLFEVMVISSR